MSKRIKKMIIEEPGWVEERAKAEEIDQEDVEMEKLAQSMPGGVRCINLYRMHKGGLGGRPKFIAQLPPEQFSEAFIQEAYGGGSYFARWQKKDGGNLKYTFDIEGPEKVQQVEPEPEEVPYTLDMPTGPQPLGVGDVLKLMADARKDAREEMRMLLEMMRPPEQPKDATAQVFGLVEKIVPMIQSGGGGGESNPWLFALTQLKEPLTKLVDTINTAVSTRTVAPAASVPVHHPAPVAAPAAVPPPKEDPDMMVKLMLKQALPILVNAATKNADPDSYADMILDQVPESAYPALKTWLERPDCLDQIAAIEPGIKFQQDWWSALRRSLIVTLTAPDGVDGVQSEDGGDSATGSSSAG